MTPEPIIAIAVQAGRDIDARFPGMRERDADDWINRVAVRANLLAAARRDEPVLANVVYGRKARGPGAKVSPDTLGIKPHAQDGERAAFYAVSIIRDNPPTNEWRARPEDHGLVSGQLWIAPEPADVGDGTQPPSTPTPPAPNPPPSEPVPDVRGELQRVHEGLRALHDLEQQVLAQQADLAARLTGLEAFARELLGVTWPVTLGGKVLGMATTWTGRVGPAQNG